MESLKHIKEVLGTPYYEAPNCLLFQADCLEGMRRLDKQIIDLTVTSPPYNIGKVYETPLPLHDYLEWCSQWIGELYRLTAAEGALWLNLGYMTVPERAKAIPIPYLLWDKIPFYLVQEIIWHYSAGVAGRKFFSPRNEKFLWYVKDASNYIFNLDDVRDPDVKYPNQKKNGRIKVNPIGKNPGDVWSIKKVTSGQKRSSKERTSHPAQFPEMVIERIIRASSLPDQVVFDPFMGSGTTAVVALGLGRAVVGFEVNSQYCDVAAGRLDNYLRQQNAPQQPLLLL